ncbi:unnamed protein product, partial [Protopolystoma xenopodis]
MKSLNCSLESPDIVVCLTSLGHLAIHFPGRFSRELRGMMTRCLVPQLLSRSTDFLPSNEEVASDTTQLGEVDDEPTDEDDNLSPGMEAATNDESRGVEIVESHGKSVAGKHVAASKLNHLDSLRVWLPDGAI